MESEDIEGFLLRREDFLLKQEGLSPAFPLQLILSGGRRAGKASIFYRLKAGNDSPLSKMRKDTKKYLNTYGGRLVVPPKRIPLKLNDSTYYLDFMLSSHLMSFSQNKSGIVYCVDSSNRKSMRKAREDLHELLKRGNLDNGEPLLVFANKQDISGAMTPKEVEDALNLHKIKDRPYRVEGCSAVTGEGLKEGVEWLLSLHHTAKECMEGTVKEMVEDPVKETLAGPVRETLEGPVRETLEGPVRETLEDGKAVLKSSQSWLSSFFSKQTVKT